MKTSVWLGCAAFAFAACSPAFAAIVTGEAVEVGSNIVHPNGNVYDQVLLTGAAASVTADPGQVTRVSFIDMNDDIVQVEFSGKGTLSIALTSPSGPAAPVKYFQPGVRYMRGLATIDIAEPDATSNISVFSVGRANAVNPSLFVDGMNYDGYADIALIRVPVVTTRTPNTAFGGIRAGNVQFFALTGPTGIMMDRTDVQGPVVVGDISANGDAEPDLMFGARSAFGTITVAGGDLAQANGRPVQVNTRDLVVMSAGATSAGAVLPAQRCQTRIFLGLQDVTDQVMRNPSN